MKTPRKSVALLLPLLLSACFHKEQQAQNQPPLAPPVVDTPPPAPDPAPKDLPPPVVTVPQTQPTPEPDPTPKTADKPAKHPVHHTTKPDSKTDAKPTEQASNSTPPEVSAIGQLSAGDPSDLRNQTEDSIASTQRGVNNLNRQLNDQEQKTVAQIREFLKQARTALTTGDVDGAHTLALKAKVLLGELNSQ
jgi:outer membrane biosynthesis protein TonB